MPELLVLLVDDEAMLTLVLEDALRDAGYAVQVAHDGDTAIAQLEADPGRFQAVVTDIRMPGRQSGWAVGHRARALQPTMPVVYMSGDQVSDWASQGVPDSIMLQKPFAMAQVVTAVSQLCNAASSRPGLP